MHVSKHPSALPGASVTARNGHVPPVLQPCPETAAVLERGVTERRFVFPDAGPARRVERWSPPALHNVAETASVERRLIALDGALQPANRGALLARVLALLSHYRMDPHPPEVEQRLADDWAEDLCDYPLWAVEEAARTWRRTRRFKPQPAEIVALCEAATGALQQERCRLQQVVEGEVARQGPLSHAVSALAYGLLRRMP